MVRQGLIISGVYNVPCVTCATGGSVSACVCRPHRGPRWTLALLSLPCAMASVGSWVSFSSFSSWTQEAAAIWARAEAQLAATPLGKTNKSPFNWLYSLAVHLANLLLKDLSTKASHNAFLRDTPWATGQECSTCLPRAQLSRAAFRSPSRLMQIASRSFWFCSLMPSAPKMKASPLELPAIRPVRGVDKVSIKFFQQPIRI